MSFKQKASRIVKSEMVLRKWLKAELLKVAEKTQIENGGFVFTVTSDELKRRNSWLGIDLASGQQLLKLADYAGNEKITMALLLKTLNGVVEEGLARLSKETINCTDETRRVVAGLL